MGFLVSIRETGEERGHGGGRGGYEVGEERDVPVSFFSLHVFSALQFFHNFSLLLKLLFSSSSWLFLWW